MRIRLALSLFAVFWLVAVGTALQSPRFDDIVRADFFAGMSGDTARFDRAMKTCEDALAADQKNAPALVWHGAGLLVRSGIALRAGRADEGMSLNARAMREMDDAVAMTADSIQVLIPRAAILVSSAPFTPPDRSGDLARTAAADYEKVLAIESPSIGSLGTHARGELLGGLADLRVVPRADHFCLGCHVQP
jgi:hypothetical protein